MLNQKMNRPKQCLLRIVLAAVLSTALMISSSLSYANVPNDADTKVNPPNTKPLTKEEVLEIEELLKNPQKSSIDFPFNYTLYYDYETSGYFSTKENDSSFYVYCSQINGTVKLRTWAWLQENVSVLTDCTYKSPALLKNTGEYQIYNFVWEWRYNPQSYTKVPARLDFQRTGTSTIYVAGCWSADCVLYWNYPVLNP